MCSDQHASSAKTIRSSAGKQDHETGKINLHGDLTTLLQALCPYTIINT